MFRTKKWLLGLMTLLPSLAFADGIGFAPPASDVSVSRLLGPLFGGLVGGGGDPLASALGVWNAALLFVGGILLSYGIIAGTMQTAHDGEVLGKRWSSMWMPIRTSMGVAAIVPMGTGYCVIQSLVMWVVLQGVGIADTMWEKFAATQQDQITYQAIIQPGKGNDIAKTVLFQQICLTTMKGEESKANANSLLADPEFTWAQSAIGTDTSNFSQNPCGSVSYKTGIMETTNISKMLGNATIPNTVGPQLDAAHKAAFTALQTSLQTVAVDIYNRKDAGGKTPKAIAQAYSTAVDTYNNAIESAAKSAAANMGKGDMNKNQSKDGWALAGAWYIHYTNLQSQLTEVFNRYPTVSAPDLKKAGVGNERLLSEINDADAILGLASYKAYGIRTQAAQMKGDSKMSDMLEDKLKDFNMPSYIATYFQPQNNPLMSASNFGGALVNWSIAAQIAVGLGAAVLTGVSLGGAIAFGQWLAPMWNIAAGGALTFGMALQYFIPMLPFLIWFGIVIGWLVLVVESLIAAPLWAVMHIHPDGDGVVGKGGQGYSLVLALVLRPPLAILGLAAAMTIIYPVGVLFTEVFWSAFALSQGGTFGFIIGIAASIIYTLALISIVKKTFSLTHVVGDQILQWIGGPSSSLGSYSQDLSNVSEGAAAKTGAAMGAVSGGTSRLGGTIGKQLREKYLKGKEKDPGKEGGDAAASKRATADPDGGNDDGGGSGGGVSPMKAGDSGATGSDESMPSKAPRATGGNESVQATSNSGSTGGVSGDDTGTVSRSSGRAAQQAVEESGLVSKQPTSTTPTSTPAASTGKQSTQGSQKGQSQPGAMTTNESKPKTKTDDDTFYTPKVPKK